MKCGSCVQAVEKILNNHPSINNASVNLVTKTALVEIKEPNYPFADVIQTLTSKGFPSKERDYQATTNNIELETNENQNLWNKWRQLIIATSLLILFTHPFFSNPIIKRVAVLLSIPIRSEIVDISIP